MYNKYFSDGIKSIYIVFGVLLFSVILGSMFCGMQNPSSSLEMREYLLGFFKSVGSINKFQTSIGKLREFLVVFGIIFVSAFFKAGVILTLGVVLRQGFVIGFTLASFLKIFGVKGLLPMFCMLPELLIFLFVLLVFSSTSTKIAFLPLKNKKNFLIFFVFFSCFSGAIFSISAFLNGYLTTTFMNWISLIML